MGEEVKQCVLFRLRGGQAEHTVQPTHETNWERMSKHWWSWFVAARLIRQDRRTVLLFLLSAHVCVHIVKRHALLDRPSHCRQGKT